MRLIDADAIPVVSADPYEEAGFRGFCKGRGWPMQLVADNCFCEKAERSGE